MITLPEVTVVGTLVADPELRFTSNGVAVANFRVASNDRKLNKETGKWEDGDATFLSCSIWRDYAEHVGESLSRGDRVVVVGRLRQREYEKDGEKRTVYEVDAEEVTPSLRFANVKVLKVDRGGSSNGGGGNAGKESGFRKSGGGTKPADDPWGSVPPPSASSDDEPPF